jgi:hypothetical protein
MGMKETIIEALKDLVLPELDEIKGEVKRNGVRLDAVERRLDDFAGRFQGSDQHRVERHLIDETNQRLKQLRDDLMACVNILNSNLNARIDRTSSDLSARIDRQALRIEGLIARQVEVAQEPADLRHNDKVWADILQRLRRLEDKLNQTTEDWHTS